MPLTIITRVSLFFLICFSCITFGQTLSPEQVEQFQRLPRAQQEALARQLGIDLSALSGMQMGSIQTQSFEQQTIYPRGTEFDEFGNPLESLIPEEVDDEDTLKLFGLELFANAPSTFAPISNIPVPANYLLGAGDTLNIQLFGKENEFYSLQINRDGSIVIPNLGPFQLATKTFSEAKAFLAEQVKNQIIGVEVSVTMGEMRTMQVFVVGEAHKPGAYQISSLATVSQALFAAGGVSEIASLRNIQVKRAGKLITSFDLYDLLLNGDASDDIILQSGDVVLIPAVQNTVAVDGLVRRPAIYELKTETNLNEVLALSGGILPEGYAEAISVKRFQQGKQIQLTADLSSTRFAVKAGDYVEVKNVSPEIVDSIMLIGAVARPGNYQWQAGQMLRDLIGDYKTQLLSTADLSYVLVLRKSSESNEFSALQFDLTSLDMQENNIELQANDKILVFSKVESEAIDDIRLEDLAFSSDELTKKEQELWQERIQQKLFWQQVGLSEAESDQFAADEDSDLQSKSIIELTEEEKERVLEFKDSTFFSRKRMLSPVIAMLREQAKFGQPLALVEVAGEVKVPGVYPLTQNASVKSIIKAAGGLTESAYSVKSEITRTMLSADGTARIEHIEFSPMNELKRGIGQSVKLISKDRINVFSVPSWQEELKVTVRGEVAFPGEYTIRRGETLLDLIERVGGLTQYGEAQSAIFTRESLKQQERANLRDLSEELRKQIASESLRRQSGAGSIVSYDEAKKLLRDLTRVEAVGRLVINLNDIIEGKEDANVILDDGDALYIPGRSQSVNVIGEVYVPSSHLYASDLSFQDYVLKSGGYKSLADESKTYIIRANGAVSVPGRDSGFWFSKKEENANILPGDTIVVPFDSDSIDNLTLWTNATQIIYQLAVAVAAIGSL